MADLASLRSEYSRELLDISNVHQNPLEQFDRWFSEALKAEVPEANAMSLSTLNEYGRPACRIVLLKGVENGKFVFYTNYQSNKGREMEKNPVCALTFFWPSLERQLRIEGTVARVTEQQSEAYFKSRPRGAQIGAWCSPQSSPIATRQLLEDRFAELEERFGTGDIPKPKQWGGYEVDPFFYEYWQGRPNRVHDRIVYLKAGNEWKINRLAP